MITTNGVPFPVILSYDKRWCHIQPSYICSVITVDGVLNPGGVEHTIGICHGVKSCRWYTVLPFTNERNAYIAHHITIR
ncbi:hypothetical protein [Segatella oulorum]|uniref:hypothetical protein n=1 Tax=Segatella oulorum TaxID=28136 RepID=UPI0028EBFF84|nr:hypothetical protein [Segatella oulorum]